MASSSTVFRQARYLSSVVTAAATATATATVAKKSTSISISQAKSRLRSEQDPDRAVKIYSSVSDRYSSPVASRYAQDLTVKRLARSRRFSDIEKLIESHKTDPKIAQEPFVCTLIRSYGLAGMFDHALKTYNQMEELGTPRTVLSFNSLLSACNQSRLFDDVPKLFDEMPHKYGFQPNKYSYGILFKSYCEKGMPELAVDKLKEMEEKKMEVSSVVYTTILHSLYKKGDVVEAERIWSEMIQKGCELDVGVYNVRLMHAQNGDPEGVKALIEEMSNSGLKPDTISYNYLMTCYCRLGRMKQAKAVYKTLEENGCNPNATTFRTLLYYLCKNEQFEAGYRVFNRSVVLNKIPNFGTLKDLAEGLVKKLRADDAKQMIKTLKTKFPPNLMVSWQRMEENLGLATVDSSKAAQDGLDSGDSLNTSSKAAQDGQDSGDSLDTEEAKN